MIHRERILKTLRGEPTDRLARGELFIADEFARALTGGAAGDAHARVVEQLDLDLVTLPFSSGWGTRSQPDTDRALQAVMHWRERDRFVFALIDGPFSAAVKALGFDTLMRYARDLPRAARSAFREGAHDIGVLARAIRDAGADGVILGDDIAYNRATFFASEALGADYFHTLDEAAHEIRALGLVAFFHSDGNLSAVLGDLAACDLDGIQGLEPEAGMSIARVRERVGNRLTLWGNVSFNFLSAERTDAEIEQTVDAIALNTGKVIFGSCGGLVGGMNVETVRRTHRWADTARWVRFS
jgi:uroporphyrinogen decarboxylase